MKNAIKSKFTYDGRGTAFDGGSWSFDKGSWNFSNYFVRNVVILVLIIVHHLILIIKNNILVLDEGEGINDSAGAAEKK